MDCNDVREGWKGAWLGWKVRDVWRPGEIVGKSLLWAKQTEKHSMGSSSVRSSETSPMRLLRMLGVICPSYALEGKGRGWIYAS